MELVKGAMNADDQRLRDAERRVFGDVTIDVRFMGAVTKFSEE